MEQFIVAELLGVFHKRDKYDDFDWVVRAIIRRKAIDFTSYYIKRNENIIFENSAPAPADGTVRISNCTFDRNEMSTINRHFLTESVKTQVEKEKSIKIIEFILEIQHKICSKQYGIYFSDWDREYVEVILESYRYGYDSDKRELMICMGYEPNEITKFNSKLLSFRNKLKKYLDLKGVEL